MNLFILPHAARMTVCADVDELAAAAAKRIAELIEDTLAAQEVCNIALAGGDTPHRCYRLLREMSLPWTRIHFYFGDERCLPIGDSKRNDTMARDSLLSSVPAANIYAIPAELGSAVAAALYAQELASAGALDLVLLGLGEDGHTASLFPCNAVLQAAGPVVAVSGAPKPPPERVSLSLSSLNAARHKLFLVAGNAKRDALQRIAQGDDLPAARVLQAEWYLDRNATLGFEMLPCE